MKIRAIIVDDEPHAREGIRLRLRGYSNVEICGECANGVDAVGVINAERPDIVFLDIQMPQMNGFEVVERITADPMPVIIFVTAYDQYAVRAFEVHALDYLLKPITEERFRKTLDLVLSEITRRRAENYSDTIRAMLREYLSTMEGNGTHTGGMGKTDPYIERLLVKSKEIVSVVPAGEIVWIESAGDYVVVHTEGQKHIMRETLASLEERLHPKQFVRIHRTAIVNVRKIKMLRTNEHGDFDIVLVTGDSLRLGRRHRENFQSVFGRVRS